VGGVFGLAKLADRLMDSWMKNPTLNANKAVAPWTQSGQAQGFKFLVTQVCDRSLENTRARVAEWRSQSLAKMAPLPHLPTMQR